MSIHKASSRLISALALAFLTVSGRLVLPCPSDLDSSFRLDGIAGRLETDRGWEMSFWGDPVTDPSGGILAPRKVDFCPSVLRSLDDGESVG